jgi:hypothetical protein
MKQDRVIVSSSAKRVVYVPVPRRPGPLRRAVRTGFLLAVIGLVRVARSPRWRSALVGAALTVPGVLFRGQLAGYLLLLPGLMALGYAPFLPGETTMNHRDHARLRREMAAYSTPAQRRDFETLLMQYSDQETSELRAILAQQSLTDTRSRVPIRGPW